MNLPEKIVALHKALATRELTHAFGGALALAWCTGRARGTIDIDLNIFVNPDAVLDVLAALPVNVHCTSANQKALKQDGQVRLWWDQTPIDLFLNTTPLHDIAAARIRWERFMDQDVPFLSCQDIAVFKAFFNRTKDWADLEEMQAAGTLDVGAVIAVLVQYLGAGDERIEKFAGWGRRESRGKG